MDNCVFCKIIKGEVPVTLAYQDDEVVIFPSNQPLAPTHLLFVPKKHIETFMDATGDLVKKITEEIQKTVIKLGLKEKSYRVIVNGGKAQEVPHLHFHLLGEVV